MSAAGPPPDRIAPLVRRATRSHGRGGLPLGVLVELVDALALRPELWAAAVHHEQSERWFGSLFRDELVDVWLLTWQQENSTDLHDHGGSSGAFHVVGGRLTEDRPVPGSASLTSRAHRAGRTVAFGPGVVHDVRNVDLTPAVSLHVYSPPLSEMTYYDRTPFGLVVRHVQPVDVRHADGGVPERAVTVEA